VVVFGKTFQAALLPLLARQRTTISRLSAVFAARMAVRERLWSL
jgi:hypothetical protein